MEKINIKEIITINKEGKFPCGTCCANICRNCCYMEMNNNHYNDGTRRCAWKGEWLSPYTPACHKFSAR